MRVKNILLCLFVSMILITLIVAEDSNSTVNNTVELQKVYNNFKCATDFYSGVISSMNSLNSSNNSSNSLNSSLTQMQNDVDQIQTYANEGNRNSLNQYVKNNFQPDHSTIKNTISGWRTANVRNLTKDQRSTLLSQYNQLKANYDTCYLNSIKDFANGRINYFNNVLNVYQKKIDALSAKGADVSSLNQIISNAKTQIIDPLQAAINSATNASSINQVVKEYCMFDGCANGTNFHLAAKFEVAKLQIALNTISSNTNLSQNSKITQLQNDITDANSVLSQVGTNAYTSSQDIQLWNDINDAYKVIRLILSSTSNAKLNNTSTNTTA